MTWFSGNTLLENGKKSGLVKTKFLLFQISRAPSALTFARVNFKKESGAGFQPVKSRGRYPHFTQAGSLPHFSNYHEKYTLANRPETRMHIEVSD